MPRMEAEQRMAQIRELLDELRDARTARGGMANLWSYLIVAAGVGVALAAVLLR